MIDLKSIAGGSLQDSITIFLAIVIEATPFIVLGVLVSAIIKAFVNEDFLLKYMPKNPFLSHLYMSLLGIVFPVCECGNVPLFRQLILKGVPVSLAISFYFGAPILNIAVIATTWIAFGNNPLIFYGRIFFGFLNAFFVGIYVHFFTSNDKSLLTDKMSLLCEHDHEDQNKGFKFLLSNKFLNFFHQEIKSMFLLLVVGAFIASITQIWIPREVLLSFNSEPIISLSIMILLAVVISVCSTVDAFIALGFAQSFSNASILGFLLYGPVVDIKAISMLTTTLKPFFILRIITLVTAFVYIFILSISSLGY